MIVSFKKYCTKLNYCLQKLVKKILTKVDNNPIEPKKEPKNAPRVTSKSRKIVAMVRSTQSGTNRSFRCFRREIYRAIVETVPTGSYLVRYTLKGPCIAVLIVSFVGSLAYLVPLVGTPMVVRVWMDFEVVMSTILIWIVFWLRFLFMRYWYFYDRWCEFGFFY